MKPNEEITQLTSETPQPVRANPRTEEDRAESRRYKTAVTTGNVPEVQRMLAAGKCTVNEALPLAVRSGQTDLVHMLLEKGVEVSVRNDLPLFFAIEGGHLAIVAALLNAGANPNSSRDLGTANIEILKLMLAAKAEPNQALRHALKQGATDCIGLLLDAGASHRPLLDEAILYAVQAQAPELIQKLLQRGFHSETEGISESAAIKALESALDLGRAEIASQLLSAGISPGKVDRSILIRCASNASLHNVVATMLTAGVYDAAMLNSALCYNLSLVMISLLIAHGANPNGSNGAPLICATTLDRPEVVGLLLCKGASPKSQNYRALRLARRPDRTEIANLILNALFRLPQPPRRWRRRRNGELPKRMLAVSLSFALHRAGLLGKGSVDLYFPGPMGGVGERRTIRCGSGPINIAWQCRFSRRLAVLLTRKQIVSATLYLIGRHSLHARWPCEILQELL